ncbi:MAG: hypothetical protein KGO82_05320, partial [Bacteroidota bacterium]|nr:hypothetical protein [Bacteroidota bacterium]
MYKTILLSLLLSNGPGIEMASAAATAMPVADTFYVDNSGDDGAEGSLLHPFKSLARVSKLALHAGDQVWFTSGQTF